MARSGVLGDMTNPYSVVEAWLYDALIAPAVAAMRAGLDGELAHVPRGGRLLDVGCGGGQIALDVARMRPDLHVTGVDLSPGQVARATRRARAAGLDGRVSFVRGSALALPLGDAMFDAVVSVASIKHWLDPARGVAECARVLRPGGALLVIEADRGARLDDVRVFVERWRLPAPLRRLALPWFRTFVAGLSLDLDDARALLAARPELDGEVARVPGAPALALRARRRA